MGRARFLSLLHTIFITFDIHIQIKSDSGFLCLIGLPFRIYGFQRDQLTGGGGGTVATLPLLSFAVSTQSNESSTSPCILTSYQRIYFNTHMTRSAIKSTHHPTTDSAHTHTHEGPSFSPASNPHRIFLSRFFPRIIWSRLRNNHRSPTHI